MALHGAGPASGPPQCPTGNVLWHIASHVYVCYMLQVLDLLPALLSLRLLEGPAITDRACVRSLYGRAAILEVRPVPAFSAGRVESASLHPRATAEVLAALSGSLHPRAS
jgi:hypothetical protein